LPLDGIMACDVGAHTHLIGQMWRTPAPGLQLMTNGWSSMGFGVPAAIAAKICRPRQLADWPAGLRHARAYNGSDHSGPPPRRGAHPRSQLAELQVDHHAGRRRPRRSPHRRSRRLPPEY
jgi:hypothetical protein